MASGLSWSGYAQVLSLSKTTIFVCTQAVFLVVEKHAEKAHNIFQQASRLCSHEYFIVQLRRYESPWSTALQGFQTMYRRFVCTPGNTLSVQVTHARLSHLFNALTVQVLPY